MMKNIMIIIKCRNKHTKYEHATESMLEILSKNMNEVDQTKRGRVSNMYPSADIYLRS
jgi:hypothetical protein